jgi:Flp pilus assembly protein CpaB
MPGIPVALPTRWRALRRRLSWHRRLLAALLTGVAVITGIAAARPAPPPSIEVFVAASDLPGGAPLSESDVDVTRLPTAFMPAGALRPGQASVAGRVLAGPMRSGEVVTDVRLVGASLLAGYDSGGTVLVAAPVRIADAGAVRLVRPGDRIDVLAAAPAEVPTGDGTAMSTVEVVASDVLVVTVPVEQDDLAVADGALIVVATTERGAGQLAGAAVTSRLSLALRPA